MMSMLQPESSPSDISPVLPEKYSGVFRTRRCGGETSDPIPKAFKVTLNIDEITLDPPLDPLPDGVPLSVQIFHDECVALYSNPDPTADPDNKTTLQALVNQLAQDFFLFRTISFDYTYLGIYNIVPVGLIDVIEFVYDADESEADDNQDGRIIELVEDRMRPNCYTRVKSEPWSGYPDQFQHWDHDHFTGSCIDSKDRTPGILMLTPDNPSTTAGTIRFGSSVLTLEDGRLVENYDHVINVTCGCTKPGCAFVYVRTTTNTPAPLTPLSGVNVSLVQGGTTISSGVTTGMVISITFINHGTKYWAAPTITFLGGGGTGAVAVAGVSGDANGNVNTIVIIDHGIDYTSAPTILIGPPNDVTGIQATATATIAAQFLLGYTSSGLSTIFTSKPGYTSTSAPLTLTCPTTVVSRNMNPS